MSASYLEMALQQHLCGLFSNHFVGIKKMELTPFIAVMRLIKLEYRSKKPELFRMLISLLHDYKPSSGTEHYQKTVQYISILLEKHPELADYLVSVLPPPCEVDGSPSLQPSAHTLHSSSIKQQHASTKPKQDGLSSSDYSSEPPAKKLRTKESSPKFYNYTLPSLSAYVASQGIPQKIVTNAKSSLVGLQTSVATQPWNVLVETKGSIPSSSAISVGKSPAVLSTGLSTAYLTATNPSIKITTSKTPPTTSNPISMSDAKPQAVRTINAKDSLEIQKKSSGTVGAPANITKPVKWTLTLDPGEEKKRQFLGNQKLQKVIKALPNMSSMRFNHGVSTSLTKISKSLHIKPLTSISKTLPIQPIRSIVSNARNANTGSVHERSANSFPYNHQIVVNRSVPQQCEEMMTFSNQSEKGACGSQPSSSKGQHPLLYLQHVMQDAPQVTGTTASSPSGIYPTIARSLQSGNRTTKIKLPSLVVCNQPKVTTPNESSGPCDDTCTLEPLDLSTHSRVRKSMENTEINSGPQLPRQRLPSSRKQQGQVNKKHGNNVNTATKSRICRGFTKKEEDTSDSDSELDVGALCTI